MAQAEQEVPVVPEVQVVREALAVIPVAGRAVVAMVVPEVQAV